MHNPPMKRITCQTRYPVAYSGRCRMSKLLKRQFKRNLARARLLDSQAILSPTPQHTGFQPNHNGLGIAELGESSQAAQTMAVYPQLPPETTEPQFVKTEFFGEVDLTFLPQFTAQGPLPEFVGGWVCAPLGSEDQHLLANVNSQGQSQNGISTTGQPQQAGEVKPSKKRRERSRSSETPKPTFRCPEPGCRKENYGSKAGLEYHKKVSVVSNVEYPAEY